MIYSVKQSNGRYSEDLKTGGELKVWIDSWELYYYFRGPDYRYNGTFVHIKGEQIDSYIAAWKNNFSKYLQLKELMPQGGNADYPGEQGMSIRFGFSEGVCLTSYHLPIQTQEQLSAIIEDYEYAKNRAVAIQRMLREIEGL
jgi:hypothetical protein